MQPNYAQWLAGIREKVVTFGILFLQIGSANEPARRRLLESGVLVENVYSFLEDDAVVDDGIVVIEGVESLARVRSGSSLGALRIKVFKCVKEGSRVILLSRAPRVAFPPVAGSSLLDDASFARGPIHSTRSIDDWPACVEDGVQATEVLGAALEELGSEVCASLDRIVFEYSLLGNEALAMLSARELEALDGAGITSPTAGGRVWNLPRHFAPLKASLSGVLAGSLNVQGQLGEVTEGLWKIERLLRREIRLKAVISWPRSWRTECLTIDLREKVLERATQSAYLTATSIKQIRDPLEWLTLGELLSLTEVKNIGDLGLSAAHWRAFRGEVFPVRNRLAHMRNLRPEDLTDVVKWRRVLESRFGQ